MEINKLKIIIAREYSTRVKKKSFIIMTLLMPLLMVAMTAIPVYIATLEDDEEDATKIAVLDESGITSNSIADNNIVKYSFIDAEEYKTFSDSVNTMPYDALLKIPSDVNSKLEVDLKSKRQIRFELKRSIERSIERVVEKQRLTNLENEIGVPNIKTLINSTKVDIRVNSEKLQSGGESVTSSSEISSALGYIMGFIIYMFIFMYGSFVMQGVMEEKQNRVVELIISTVKPFTLLMGKIIGVALVALTQVSVWIAVGTVIIIGLQGYVSQEMAAAVQHTTIENTPQVSSQIETISGILESVESINAPLLILSFAFFFLAGFLFYSSLMAAIASAVDTPEDAQQLMWPITIPLIISIMLLTVVIKNPDSAIAVWSSFIPFTAPIIMVVRIPFDIPTWQIVGSMVMMIVSFIGSVWCSAKIYRTGILLYGKKITFKELIKWLRW